MNRQLKQTTQRKKNNKMKENSSAPRKTLLRKFLLVAAGVLSFTSPLFAQNQAKNFFISEEADFRDYATSVLEITFINLFVKEADQIARGYPWNPCSWETITHNLTTPWLWDNSSFVKNQAAHVYFGNMYYNVARTSDLNVLQSSAMAALGSFMWETVMEAGTNSLGDFLATAIAGSLTGEVLFRLSNEAYLVHPVLGWLTNPTGNMNYFITQNQRDLTSCLYSADYKIFLGYTSLQNSYEHLDESDKSCLNELKIQGPSINAQAEYIYNDPYGHSSNEFLDQFNAKFLAGGAPGRYQIGFDFDGTIFSLAPGSDSKKDNTLGICEEYYFSYSNTNYLSLNSAGIFFKQRINFQTLAMWGINASYNFVGVTNNLMKATEDSLIPLDYTYTNGPKIKAFLAFDSEQVGTLNFSFQADYLMSYKQRANDRPMGGDFLIFMFDTSYSHRIFKSWNLGVSASYFKKIETASKGPFINEELWSLAAFMNCRL